MSIHYLDILNIVVTVCTSDLIQEIETLLQFLIELYMMNGLTHFFNFGSQLIFLVWSKLIMMITTLCKCYLEANLSLL